MITYLPVPSFEASAMLLSDKHLANQRLAAHDALKTLLEDRKQDAMMWYTFAGALADLGLAYCIEFAARGGKDTMHDKILELVDMHGVRLEDYELPYWFYGKTHAAHRSALLRADPLFYRRYGWAEPANLPLYHDENVACVNNKPVHSLGCKGGERENGTNHARTVLCVSCGVETYIPKC